MSPTVKAHEPEALPVPADSFVGRAGELEAVAAALRVSRIVTLVGPGGVGKTRLALELLNAQTKWPVRMIDLSSTVDDLLGQRLLLLLDGCEHVAEQAAVLVTTLLERCPDLKVLATSRETLRVPGEVAYRLPPLEPEHARRLFLDRAGRAPTDELLDHLEGMPLAVEVAASTGSTTGLVPAIERSYRLLSADEREVLRRLSVWVDGFGIDAVRTELPVVLRLNTKSLLQRVDGDRTQFRMLASVRRFAAAELRARPAEQADASDRMVRWLEELARPMATDVRTSFEYVRSLDTEAANLVEAMSHVRPYADQWVLLASAVARAWQFRGRIEATARLLDTALTVDSAHRSVILGLRAEIAVEEGQLDRAIRYAAEAFGTAPSHPLRLRALLRVAYALRTCGRMATGEWVYRRAIALADELGERLVRASAQQNLAWSLLGEGEWQRARELVDQALPVYRAQARPSESVTVLHTSAAIQLALGDLGAAQQDLAEAAHLEQVSSVAWPYLVEGFAIIAQRRGDAYRCMVLLGATGRSADRTWRRWVDEARARSSAELTARQLAAAETHAASLDHAALLRYATGRDGTPLTARERQIAALLADGLANHEIATRLGIATSTVANGIDRIKNKLGIFSRAELITWHVELSA